MKCLKNLCLNTILNNFEEFIDFCIAKKLRISQFCIDLISSHYSNHFYPDKDISLVQKFRDAIASYEDGHNAEELNRYEAYVTQNGIDRISEFLLKNPQINIFKITFDSFKSCKGVIHNKLQHLFMSIGTLINLREIQFMFTLPNSFSFDLSRCNMFNSLIFLNSVKFLEPFSNSKLLNELFDNLTTRKDTLEYLFISFNLNEHTMAKYLNFISQCTKLRKIKVRQTSKISRPTPYTFHEIIRSLFNSRKTLVKIDFFTCYPLCWDYIVCFLLVNFPNLYYISIEKVEHDTIFLSPGEENFLKSATIKHPNLKKLRMNGNFLSQNTFINIINNLNHCTSLQQLIMKFKTFMKSRDYHHIEFQEELKFTQSVKEIQLSGQNLNKIDSENIGIFLGRFHSLERFSFNFQFVDEEAAHEIFLALLPSSHKLKILNISYNLLDDEAICPLLERCYGLESISLKGFSYESEALKGVLKEIFFLGETLRILNLSNCNICADDGTRLGQVLMNFQCLEAINIEENTELTTCYPLIFEALELSAKTLTSLIIGSCTITSAGLNSLIMLLQRCHHIEEFSFFTSSLNNRELSQLIKGVGLALHTSIGSLRKVNDEEGSDSEFTLSELGELLTDVALD